MLAAHTKELLFCERNMTHIDAVDANHRGTGAGINVMAQWCAAMMSGRSQKQLASCSVTMRRRNTDGAASVVVPEILYLHADRGRFDRAMR